MNVPVDLANLRSMTDGDREMEVALFEEFYSSFETGIAELEASVEAPAAETWRKQAHALKGVALNLGAGHLGELGKKAQDEYQAGAEAKTALVQSIRTEYEQVKLFLQKLAA